MQIAFIEPETMKFDGHYFEFNYQVQDHVTGRRIVEDIAAQKHENTDAVPTICVRTQNRYV
jgi:hypothetical protein